MLPEPRVWIVWLVFVILMSMACCAPLLGDEALHKSQVTAVCKYRIIMMMACHDDQVDSLTHAARRISHLIGCVGAVSHFFQKHLVNIDDQLLWQGGEQDAATNASIRAILQEASAAALHQELPVRPELFLPGLAEDEAGAGALATEVAGTADAALQPGADGSDDDSDGYGSDGLSWEKVMASLQVS